MRQSKGNIGREKMENWNDFPSLPADKIFRKCLANGTWASKSNYSQCKAILSVQVKCDMRTHRHIAKQLHKNTYNQEQHVQPSSRKCLYNIAFRFEQRLNSNLLLQDV